MVKNLKQGLIRMKTFKEEEYKEENRRLNFL